MWSTVFEPHLRLSYMYNTIVIHAHYIGFCVPYHSLLKHKDRNISEKITTVLKWIKIQQNNFLHTSAFMYHFHLLILMPYYVKMHLLLAWRRKFQAWSIILFCKNETFLALQKKSTLWEILQEELTLQCWWNLTKILADIHVFFWKNYHQPYYFGCTFLAPILLKWSKTVSVFLKVSIFTYTVSTNKVIVNAESVTHPH